MYTTKVLPKQWNMQFVKGDRVPPIAFKIVDFNGEDFDDYEPFWYVHDGLHKPAKQTLEDGEGLSKVEAVTRMDLSISLAESLYQHYLQVKTNNDQWVFTVAAGEMKISHPGNCTGSILGIEQMTFKLPIIKTAEGALQIVDENGTPIISEDGSFIETES